ncbi:hypothetical protein QNO07_22340 [Streptomyces sp. 549]|uniref:hypothetical protein n=1 Tax=Streptomyces sp. 549 TaxID=3049076 RepID=UPI0024C43FEF|nr:hypothetical protein [Streptomyces sp. 549]MDK1476123.1 hypothetical protein [Streptomyces sp. 549]
MTVLRGSRADRFLAEVTSGDAQLVLRGGRGSCAAATSAPPTTTSRSRHRR